MFSAYASGSSGGGADPPRGPNNSYSSFPTQHPKKEKKRDYAEENRIKEARRLKEAKKKMQLDIDRIKEAYTFRQLQERDSSEEDDCDMPKFLHGNVCVSDSVYTSNEITAKHRQFVTTNFSRRSSSSPSSDDSRRKKKKRHRKRSSSFESERKRRKRSRRKSSSSISEQELFDENPESSLLYEGTIKGSRARFRVKTKNQKTYPQNERRTYKYQKYFDERLPHNQVSFTDYFPSHENYEYDICEKRSKVDTLLTNVAQSSNSEKIIILDKISLKNQAEVKPEIAKKERIFMAKFNPKRYENVFRFYTDRFDEDFVEISNTSEEFLYQHELDAQRKSHEIYNRNMEHLAREARGRNDTDNEKLLKIKLAITEDRGNAQLYLDLCNAEDEVFEQNRLQGLQTNNKSAINDRKITILDKGIKFCIRHEALVVEKMKLLKEIEGVEAVIESWKKIISRYPNSLALYQAYLDHIQYDGLVYTRARMENAFEKCRKTLEGIVKGTMISHPKQEGTEDFIFKVWVRELKWLMEQGELATAIASIQASIEFYYFNNSNSKIENFKQFWNSGQPRVGDFNYEGGFLNFKANTPKDLSKYLELEAKEIKEEFTRAEQICDVIKEGATVAEDYINLEIAMDSICIRPIRNKISLFSHLDEDIQDHLKERTYVPFEDLKIMTLKMGEHSYALPLLRVFGIETFDLSDNADLYTVSQDLDVLRHQNTIPADVLLYLTRIYWALIEATKNSPSIYKIVPNFANYAAQKAKTNKEMSNIVGQYTSYLKGDVASSFPNINYLLTAEMREFIDYQSIKEVILKEKVSKKKREERAIKLVEHICRKAKNYPSIEFYERIALDSIVFAAEHLESIVFYKRIIRWVKMMRGENEEEAAPDEIAKIKNLLMTMSMEAPGEDTENLKSIMPSRPSLACALTIHILASEDNRYNYNRLELAKKIYLTYVSNHPEDVSGVQEIHYAIILFMYREWTAYHRRQSDLTQYMREHIEKFQINKRLLKIGICYLKSKAATVMPYLKSKTENPLDYFHRNNNNEVLAIYDAVIKIELANREIIGSADIKKNLEAIHCGYLLKEAEKRRDPYLWTMTMSKTAEGKVLDVYTKATAQCKWSKGVHFERLRSCYNNVDDILTDTCKFMDDSGIKRNFSPEDVETFRVMYKNRRNRPQNNL